ncbi:hypothetical protein FRB90_002361 [Tulasnella sp. 427]|nr:hypothetical protein FRB90_002361 [Tulasnella sp. 427]
MNVLRVTRGSTLRLARASRLVSTSSSTQPSSSSSDSSSSPQAVLVGSPDVISNLRPAIYDGVWFKAVETIPDDPATWSSSTLIHPDKETEHPYALSEFPLHQEREPFFEEKQEWRMQERLMKQSLDAFNHAFWTDTNTRFNAYKHFIETSTKSSPEYAAASPEVQEELLLDATASFYRLWQRTEEKRQKAYTKEMYRRTWGLIWYGARMQVQKLRWALRSIGRRDLL